MRSSVKHCTYVTICLNFHLNSEVSIQEVIAFYKDLLVSLTHRWNIRKLYFHMVPLLLVVWYFKLPFEPNQLMVYHAPRDKPKFCNGRFNGRSLLIELEPNQCNREMKLTKYILTVPDSTKMQMIQGDWCFDVWFGGFCLICWKQAFLYC